MAPAPLGQHRSGWTVQPGLSPGVKDSDAVAVNLIVGMEWPKAVSTTPKDIHVTTQHCGRVEVPPACRVALCTDKSPCHGAGIQLVNVIGKAICQLLIASENVHGLAQDTS